MKTAEERAYKTFLERLRSAREEAGYSQSKVSRLLRKPQSYVSKCESGDRRVDVIELKALCKIYRKKLSDFD